MVLSTPTRGAHPKPRLRPRADLWYAPVIKHRHRSRVIAVQTGVIFGDPAAVTAQLAQPHVSQTINTCFVERTNLTQRTNGFAKDVTWHENLLWLSLAHYPLILPHASLRNPSVGFQTHARHRFAPAMAPHDSGGGSRYGSPG